MTAKTDRMIVKDRQRPWTPRRASWVVLRGIPPPRGRTLRLDGYDFVRTAADRVAVQGAYGRASGRVALVLEVSPGTAAVAIPDALFKGAVPGPLEDPHDVQRAEGDSQHG